MIDHLKSIKKHHFHFFSARDVSFFFSYTRTGHLWLPETEPPPEMPTAKFDEKKVMISIFWYPYGIQVIKTLPTGEHFNVDYFQKEILSDLTRTQDVYQAKYEKQQFCVHFDNPRSHKAKSIIAFCKANTLTILPHPPYSPDLAQSDFFSFRIPQR
jgi:histone-lysine N-methyltransferase SETMAR